MNLFAKIFLWFLLATAVMVGVAVFLTWTMQSEPLVNRFQGIAKSQTRIQAETAAQIHRYEGDKGVAEHLERISKNESTGAVALLDEGGHFLVNNGVNEDRARPIAMRAIASGETEFDFPPRSEGLLAHRFVTGDGRRFAIAVRWNRPPPPPFFDEWRVRWLRLAALILTAIVGCWLLARYLSAPIVRLSSAVRELAAGNLSARVAPQFGRRRDEFGDLARDFDEMAERIESLVRSEKRLTRDISHELRSPLARLNVALEIARSKAGPDTLPMLDRIGTESIRLNEMIGRILTLSELARDSEGKELEAIDLAGLVRSVAEDADFEARAKGRAVVCGDLAPVVVPGDEPLLRSAVENVLRNAVHYTREGTEVTVELGDDGAAALLTVEDAGAGVPEEELEQIFRPFYRTAEARERGSGGVGLGLAIARRAVAAHNGTIRAENTEGGLRVTIRLPLNGGRR